MIAATSSNKISNSEIGGTVIAVMQKALWLRNKLGASASERANARVLAESTRDPFANSIVKHPQYWPAGIPITTRLQETYTYQAEVTRHAVESGSIMSDHVILQPVRIDLSFEVSNFAGNGQAKKSLDDFVKLWSSRKLFDLVTEHRIVKDCVCVAIQADNSVPEWGKLAFRALFQQSKFGSLEVTKYPASKVIGGDAAKSAESPVAQGTQSPRVVPVLEGKGGIFKGKGATGSW